MKVSSSSNASATTRLKEWLCRPEVKGFMRLEGPSKYEYRCDSYRESKELEDRTRVADKVMVEYFGSDVEFTAILNEISPTRGSIRTPESKKLCRNAVRDALEEIQRANRDEHLGNTCAYSRTAVAA